MNSPHPQKTMLVFGFLKIIPVYFPVAKLCRLKNMKDEYKIMKPISYVAHIHLVPIELRN